MLSEHQKANVEQKIAYYRGLIAEMPKFTPFRINSHLKLGQLYIQIGDKEAAINEYSIAAVQYTHNGALVKAIAVNKMIAELEPEHENALINAGSLYFQQEESGEHDQQHTSSFQETDEAGQSTVSSDRQQKSLSEFATEEEGEEAEIATFLKQTPLFYDLSWAERQWLEERIKVYHFAENALIQQKTDQQESLFLIFEGAAKVVLKDKDEQQHVISILEIGDFFGEISLFAKTQRCASIMAGTTCMILEISKPVLATLIKKHPQIAETLKEYSARRVLDNKLANVPLFTHLDPDERQKIADFLTLINVKKEEMIVKEGEIGDCMYLIKSGQVGVYTTVMNGEEANIIQGEQEQLHLATLQDGDFFGEQALIVNEPRNASIIALTDAQLLRLSKAELSAIVNAYPRVGELLGKYHQRRTTDTLEALNTAFQQIAAQYESETEEEWSAGLIGG